MATVEAMFVDPSRNLVMMINAWNVLGIDRDIEKEILERVVAATSDGSCPATQ